MMPRNPCRCESLEVILGEGDGFNNEHHGGGRTSYELIGSDAMHGVHALSAGEEVVHVGRLRTMPLLTASTALSATNLLG